MNRTVALVDKDKTFTYIDRNGNTTPPFAGCNRKELGYHLHPNNISNKRKFAKQSIKQQNFIQMIKFKFIQNF